MGDIVGRGGDIRMESGRSRKSARQGGESVARRWSNGRKWKGAIARRTNVTVSFP
jgi:hypothetical protein